jgi:hypothetical protein
MISKSQHPLNMSVAIEAYMELVSADTIHVPLEEVVASREVASTTIAKRS